MIGLDTNVVLRFLAQDDAEQSPIATRVFSELTAEEPGFVSAVVLVETTWVMARRYDSSREEIADVVERLLRSAELIVENAEATYRALALFRSGRSVEFSDALIAMTGKLAGADETVTFDQRAAKQAGMRLLEH